MHTELTISRFSRNLGAAWPILPILLLVTMLTASFNVAAQSEEQRVKDYIAKQKAAGIAPKPSNPHWKAGFTCNDLKQFSFAEYQECRYYYAVHGRFYKS